MSLFCPCGFDCTEFMAHHQISADALFSCPVCDNAIRAQIRASPQSMRNPSVFTDAELTFATGVVPVS
jgi:hypothetical protein